MFSGSLNTNISAMHIIQQINKTEDRFNTNLARISTGLRINSAKDDPGAFRLSSKLETEFRGLSVAADNIQTAVNTTNTALSAVNAILDVLNEMYESAVAASGGSATEQDTILEQIEALNDIADTTRFNGKFLLNGSLTTEVDFKSGTRDVGASLSFGPDATTLIEGRSYLNLSVNNSGSQQLENGGDATFNTGVASSGDLAVSVGQFYTGAAAAGTGDTVNTLTANRVTLQTTSSISYSGLLADGTTFFSGTFSISTGTVADLIADIQSTIDTAESFLGIDGTGTLETTVGISNTGRLTFSNGGDTNYSEFDINLTVVDSSDMTQTSFGVERIDTLYNSETGETASGSLIGNSISAITGSTFDSGTFTITVNNVVSAQQNQITTDTAFLDSGSTAVLATTAVDTSLINGFTINAGDTFTIDGTDPDGTTFQSVLTVGVDTGIGDGIIEDFGDLIDELNNRDLASATTYGFSGAIATLTGAGTITLYDDVAEESSTSLSITVSTSTAQTIGSTVDQAGTRETATISIDSGTAQTVTVGEVVTLTGSNLSGGPDPEVTFRVGDNFVAGSDQITTTAREYIGALNGGAEVTFQNGDQGVVFTSGSASIYPNKQFQKLTLDFDAIVDITSTDDSGGETFVLSSSSNALNFRIGSGSNSDKQFLFADLTSDNLGSSATQTLNDLDVSSASGATEALDIISDAIDQVTNFGSRLGAFSNRLESTVDFLDSASLAIKTAHSDIVSIDLAKETTELAYNTILLQAQASILVQANTTGTRIYEILYGLG